MKRETEKLAVTLSPSEFKAKAVELAAKHQQIALVREEHKERKGEMKLQLETLEQERTELARIVKDQAEERTVEIELHADDARGVMQYVRMDTGEVYRERALAGNERQEVLALPMPMPSGTKGAPRVTPSSTAH